MRQHRRLSFLRLGLISLFGCNPSVDENAPYNDLRTCTPESGSLQQEELLSFEGCQRLDGSLVLRNDFHDRTNLGSIVVITGNLSGGGYVGENLTLEGLDSLEIVEGGFGFFEDNLVGFSGVPRLRSVGGLSVRVTPELEDFRGLEGLREVHGPLRVVYNPKLRTLAGLEGLEHVYGDFTIAENPMLPRSEVDALLDHVIVDGEITVQ